MNMKVMRWFVWGIAAAFYLYEYFLRVSPTVMADDLMSSFNIQAGAFGLLTAAYFISYAPMQLPVGMLVDRFGARKLLTFATLVCGGGSLLFALAGQIWLAGAGRFFIGMGSAFAFVSIVYVSSHWFPPERMALLIALGNSCGMIGAIGGESLLAYLVDTFSWRPSMVALAVVGFLLALITYLGMRREGPRTEKQAAIVCDVSMKECLKEVTKNRNSWINGFFSMTFYSTMTAFAGVWAVPFIHNTYGLSKELAAAAVSMNFIGWLIGGPFVGLFSDRIHHRKEFIMASALLALVTIGLIIYLPPMPTPLLYFLFFLIGVFSSAQLLNFSIAVEINSFCAKGTSAAFTNLITSMGGLAFPPLIGFVLDKVWSGKMLGNLPAYSAMEYRIALTCIPLALILAFILGFFLNERKHESHNR